MVQPDQCEPHQNEHQGLGKMRVELMSVAESLRAGTEHRSCPTANISIDAGPDKSGCDQLLSGSDARV